jgi:hypothetical protein
MQKPDVFLRSVIALFLVLCVNVVLFGQSPPGISPEPGFYTTTISVSFFGVPGDEIYYTLDGSEPNESSFRYNAPISLSQRDGETASLAFISNISSRYAPWSAPTGPIELIHSIRYRTKRGDSWGKTATATYIINPEGASAYSLPILSLVTDSLSLFDHQTGIYVLGPKYDTWFASNPTSTTGTHPANYYERGEEWERVASFEMFEPTGERVISQDIGIRIHGGLSRALRAKSFRLYSRSDYGVSRFRYEIFPDLAQDNFNRLILRASGQDWNDTMFRDALLQRLAGHLSFETLAYRPALLFINGEFWGIYNIRERYDRHYFQIKYGLEDDSVDLLTQNAAVKEGSNSHYLALRTYIRGGVGTSRYEYIQSQMDVQNFIEYNVSNIYYNNRDWPHNNIDFWRYNGTETESDGPRDGRWRWLMFDTDMGFAWTDRTGRLNGAYESYYTANTLEFASRTGTNGCNLSSTEMLCRLLSNVEFRRKFINTYRDLANSAFRSDRIISEIDEMSDVIRPYMQSHIDRWGYQNHRWSVPHTTDEWESNVEILREFARARESAVNEHFTDMFGLSTLYTIPISVNDTTMGDIRINNTRFGSATPGVGNMQQPAAFQVRYFRDVEIEIAAEPRDGYRFVMWTNQNGVEQSRPQVFTATAPVGQIRAVFEPDVVSVSGPGEIPSNVSLSQNYPNPFNPSTQIRFELPEATSLRLEVFDVTGRSVMVVADGVFGAGPHQVTADLQSYAGGVYFYRLTTPNESITRSMVLIK